MERLFDINKSKKFDINTVTKDFSNETPCLSKELIQTATEIVLKEMTEVRGTIEEVETQNMVISRCAMGDKTAQINVKAMIKKIIEKDYKLAQPPLSDALTKQIYEDNYGLGAIDDLFNDPSINEIWVNGWDHIWIEKEGIKRRLKDKRFKSDEDIIRIIRLLLKFDKKDITTQDPMKESRMLDGSRITVLVPPVAKRPYINIRKFDAFDVTTENLIQAGTVTPEMIEWIKKAVRGRANILIIGETGSGKTSLLKWLVDFVNPNLRIGTIETNFELKLDEKYPDRNIFCYEEHPELGIFMADLFRKCLRSSPDIIICGEARGAEADELIMSMRRGHPGSLGTIHTNSPETAVDDLSEMINQDGKRRDPIQLRHRIASAIDLIIQVRRFEDTGIRRITKVTEVISNSDSYEYYTNDIYRYEVDKDNPTKGNFIKSGKISDTLKNKLNYYNISYSDLEDM